MPALCAPYQGNPAGRQIEFLLLFVPALGIIIFMKVLKSNLSIMVIALVLALMGGQLHANQTDRWVGDIPILSGLSVVSDLSFSFDSPSGRILVIYAQPEIAEMDVVTSYGSALNALGWTDNKTYFSRANEELKIEKVSIADLSLWRFSLTPRAEP